MIDKFELKQGESYTFLTDNQYVVVVSIGNNLDIYKGDNKLASIDWLEDFSSPANTGEYTLKANEDTYVLLVRYILI